MYQFVSVLVILVSILLVLIVLVQNSKGGGLASNFSASNQVMGVRKTADFLEKATWSLAGGLLVLAFVSVMVLPRGEMQSGAAIDEEIQNMNVPSQELPDFGVGGEDAATQETAGDSL
ncbi:preprotein translocase subunit SecG [Marinilabilia salmonicolor]|jgi:preprotein translocase subunit SecG|uniref:Protein-export membrane protein SecG n=1 Tax=Marinilabilia salmonicolor TaxID=989 RepID=A0A2T0XLP4_9BACT|nr:preprotein translocase subunit SecG [Marinilabilia salmonicolor]PRY99830.1 protein translocase subunit secG [Marinilabilia salmonicolor]RCW37373.1 protein translocase subunit secG [Marinilabilia salmonicolor]